MAHPVSAKKRVRQNLSHRSRNRWRLRSMRVAIKDFETKLSAGDTGAQEALKSACSIIDRTAQNGVIHKRQAARRKSRLTAQLMKTKSAS